MNANFDVTFTQRAVPTLIYMISYVRRGARSHATLQTPLLLTGVQRLFSPVANRSFSSAADAGDLLVNQKDGLGCITINRPKALNAKNCGELVTCSSGKYHHSWHSG